jgi:photosystem II stability/assembly factor-like uncharacterized protein
MKTAKTSFAVNYVKNVVIAMALLGWLFTVAPQALAQTGWTVGEDSIVLCFDGKTWVPDAVPIASMPLYDVSRASDTGELWAVGAREKVGKKEEPNGVIFHRKTGDCGAKWDDQTPLLKKNKIKTDADLYGVFALDHQHVWAVGQSGTILFYDGKKWTKQDSKTTAALNTVYATGENTAWAAGAVEEGKKTPTVLYMTKDKGWQWSKELPKVAVSIRSIQFAPNGQNGYLVGDAGLGIWESYDGGVEWLPDYYASNVDLTSKVNLNRIIIGAANSTRLGYTLAAAGGDPKNKDAAVFLYHYFDTDKGSWNWRKGSPAVKTLNGLARSGDQFWVVSSDGNMRWTETGGKTWSKINTAKEQESALHSIVMVPPKKKSVKLQVFTSPRDGTAGVTYLSLAGFEFLDGKITPTNVAVELASECHGGPAARSSAVSVVSGSGDSRLISFQLPGGLEPGQYFVSISDSDEDDVNFDSSNCSVVNVVQ